MKVKHKTEEIYSNVFLVGIENSYDLTMTFCRIQEFYESPYKEIRGKYFTMMEFQRLYSMRRGDGCFTYPIDWAGFNIPSNIIKKYWDMMYAKCRESDWNEYDIIFEKICKDIEKNKPEKYYIIGSDPKSKTTIEHEISHAFYYLYAKYKKDADKITKEIPEKIKNKVKKWLLSIGYNDKVFKDELQAYVSTEPDTLTCQCDLTTLQENKIEKIHKQLKELKNEYRIH